MFYMMLLLSLLPFFGLAHPVAEPADSTVIPINLPTVPVKGLWSNNPIYFGLVLQHHNVHRANHSAENLQWNQTLAKLAEEVAMSCEWGHNLAPGGGGYGQNIAAGFPPSAIGKVISNGFYNSEFSEYPGPWGQADIDMTNFGKWGHLSQVLWKDTKTVGCYTHTCTPSFTDTLKCKSDGTSYLSGVDCGNGGIPAQFTVCNYYPLGNVYTWFNRVGAPKSHATVEVTDSGTTGL